MLGGPNPQNPDQNRAFSTGEVLAEEFKLIHGELLWDPDAFDARRAAMLFQARAALPRDSGEYEREPIKAEQDRLEGADRLGKHAWSVSRLPYDQAALCLSGGGIRSAAFGLGILQGLARRNLLGQFHYLSTVSGGGYIGSWLTAWRCREGFDTVDQALSSRHFGAEPTPFQRLRFNQNFLTPKVGLGSADTWTALAAIIRNLTLNWLVFLPLLLGLLLLPRVIEAAFVWMQQGDSHSSIVAMLPWMLPLHANEQKTMAMASLDDWRSWADLFAVIAIWIGFVISAYNRPAAGTASLRDGAFVFWVLTPVLLGTIVLTAAAASWLHRLEGSFLEVARWALLGAMAYVAAPLIAGAVRLVKDSAAFLRARQQWGMNDVLQALKERKPGSFLGELAAWSLAGLCTGALVGGGAWLCWKATLPTEFTHTVGEQWHLARLLTVAGPPWILLSFLAGEVLYTGLASRLPYGEEDREWLARAAGWFGAVAVAYFVFFGLVLFGWDTITDYTDRLKLLTAGSGVLALLGALTPLTRATAASAMKDRFPITPLITALSAIFILGAIAWLAEESRSLLDWLRSIASSNEIETKGIMYYLYELAHVRLEILYDYRRFADPVVELVFVAGLSIFLLLISAGMSLLVNVNWFSLHAFYRNRLVKTFLGASNVGKLPEAEGRNRFNGFSEKDNLPIASISEIMRQERDAGQIGRLYPVINMSLNVLASKNLAWQERKAEPFICTPLFTGGDRVHYRPSEVVAAGRGGLQRSISIGTAMAISGAAVSPNWGYHSSPITSFLMMLANVRLGWWLGNPQHKSVWRYRGPRFSWRLFLEEALGRTEDKQPWIYLSDGGHFENLGIYEMARRRCRIIVVSDAGADPNCTLEDLGNAVRKVSIDLGVKIEFDRIRVRKRSDIAKAGVYCAVGTIRYPEDDPTQPPAGRLVYFKPGFYGVDEPADVRAYAAANAKFPHESTLNQWFGESQFESYRSLGAYVIETICRERFQVADLGEFVEAAQAYLAGFEKNFPADGTNIVEIRNAVQVVAKAGMAA